MKILHIIFSFNIGGAENLLIDIINRQALRYKLSLCIINDVYNEDLLAQIDKRVELLLLNRRPGSQNIVDVIKLNYHLLHFNPSVIHCHDSNIIKYLFLRRFYKTVLTIHATRLPLDGIMKYNIVVSVSKAIAQELKQRKLLLTSTVVYNGVEADAIHAKDSPDFPKQKDTISIVQVGRLEHDIKGQDLAIKAIALLQQKFPYINIQLDLIGGGSSAGYLRKLSIELGIENRVHFLGIKSREYIYSQIKNYDLLIQPSIYEGFGLTVAEGMIAGLPVLVANVEGPMEIIQNGKYGFFFHSNNIENMVQKLSYIIQHVEIVNEISLKGKQYSSSKFNILNTIDAYDNIYNNNC